jgi:hypothetical protein
MPDIQNTLNQVESQVEESFHTVQGDVHDYFYGGNNITADIPADQDGNLIEPEDYHDTDCEYLMQDEVNQYWNTVFAMVALFLAAFLLPYLLCCCNSRWPRCASRWFFWNGVAHCIVGALLASSTLMPNCLEKLCGVHFCKAHKYNPGQVWGGVVIGFGFVLHMKACSQWRYARKLEKDRTIATQAEKGALVSTIDTMMDESQRGSSYSKAPYRDANFPEEASSRFVQEDGLL